MPTTFTELLKDWELTGQCWLLYILKPVETSFCYITKQPISKHNFCSVFHTSQPFMYAGKFVRCPRQSFLFPVIPHKFHRK
jgi:hypothetical protein